MPPASPTNVACGCSTRTTASTSPEATAAASACTAAACSPTGAGGGAEATVRRAREAACRAAAGVTASIAAISPKGTPNPSCSTNATRCSGVRVSSTISAASRLSSSRTT